MNESVITRILQIRPTTMHCKTKLSEK